jgi:putative endonuclease
MPDTGNTSRSTNRRRGTAGEDLAAAYLARKGYRILQRNFYFGRNGEIDIIARDGEVLVFIEVKARSSSMYGSPEEAVTAAKQRTLRLAAQGYCYIHNIVDTECRFDVVAVELHSQPPAIRHLIGAF